MLTFSSDWYVGLILMPNILTVILAVLGFITYCRRCYKICVAKSAPKNLFPLCIFNPIPLSLLYLSGTAKSALLLINSWDFFYDHWIEMLSSENLVIHRRLWESNNIYSNITQFSYNGFTVWVLKIKMFFTFNKYLTESKYFGHPNECFEPI